MYVHLKDQLVFLVVSFLCGFALSIVYDIFRVLRMARGYNITTLPIKEDRSTSFKIFSSYTDRYLKSVKRKSNSWIGYLIFFIDDLLFFLILTISVLIVVYGFSNGIPRAFSFLALLCGFYVWRYTFSRVVLFIFLRLFFVLGGVLFFVFYPIIILFEKFKKLIYKAKRLLYNNRVKRKEKRELKNSSETITEGKTIISSGVIYMEKR